MYLEEHHTKDWKLQQLLHNMCLGGHYEGLQLLHNEIFEITSHERFVPSDRIQNICACLRELTANKI